MKSPLTQGLHDVQIASVCFGLFIYVRQSLVRELEKRNQGASQDAQNLFLLGYQGGLSRPSFLIRVPDLVSSAPVSMSHPASLNGTSRFEVIDFMRE